MFKRLNGFYKLLLIFAAVGLFSVVFSAVTGRNACLLYNIAGLPCPSCGMTRAWLALLKGDLPAAFHYHPLFFMIILIPVFFIIKGMTEKIRNRFFIAAAALFIVVWIGRMALFFPHTEPFEFNNNALIPMMIDLWKHV